MWDDLSSYQESNPFPFLLLSLDQLQISKKYIQGINKTNSYGENLHKENKDFIFNPRLSLETWTDSCQN